MPSDLEQAWSTYEREYRIYKDCVLKRSLKPSEYKVDSRGRVYVPIANEERLKNEAACLQFIKRKTKIPVPDVLAADNQDDSFCLWTRRVHGVPMKDLSFENREIVIIELEAHLRTLQNLRSDRIGGPTRILCLPNIVTVHFPNVKVWPAISSNTKDFVFCHCHLSQSNIIVHPDTLKITGIIGWEFAGFFPSFFESPFYLSAKPSGAQVRDFKTKELVDFIHHHDFGATQKLI
ncbi:hypothetical protein VE03_08725 [Pseudogymnoascus sp. 23342-1-I1]|nr:hypothetical protein VE03_08725 [Pseudogymnoascus sp. 23342-1-I1]